MKDHLKQLIQAALQAIEEKKTRFSIRSRPSDGQLVQAISQPRSGLQPRSSDNQRIPPEIQEIQSQLNLPSDFSIDIHIERTRNKQHGDFATNIALILAKVGAKVVKRQPRQLAELIISNIPSSDLVEKIEIAGPGFINFYIKEDAFQRAIPLILAEGDSYGKSHLGAGTKIHLEFVSANPTGPLHVGHGRGAAFGASLAQLLETTGFNVHREYYVNDAGRQIDILTVSVWLRYLAEQGITDYFPVNAYRGDYVRDIAKQLQEQQGDRFAQTEQAILQGLPPDESMGGDKEKHVDALIQRAKQLLSNDNYRVLHDFGLNIILDDIRDDLAEFGVTFQTWYSEQQLNESGAIQRAIEQLRHSKHLYTQDDATWFNAIHFGDEKDRVLVRANGQTTYFASDVAYHMDKFNRGFDKIIDIFGADHHGYISRIKASIEALGQDANQFSAYLVQFAILYRGTERVQMSTRSGSFVTLRELREEVGNDAARFFYVMRKVDQHMDFDLELAKSQTADNPVYYIQYAHARICSVLRQLAEKKIDFDQSTGENNVSLLHEPHEKTLLVELSRYPEVIEAAALACEPHQVAHYLRDLANCFHIYYNAHQFIVDDSLLRNARICLIIATRQILANGLKILGVSTPEKM